MKEKDKGTSYAIRIIAEADRLWVAQFLKDQWGGPMVVSRGRLHQADRLQGFIAWQEDQRVGLVTYHIEGDQCEIVSLDSLVEGIGIGSALIDAVRQVAQANGLRRLWLITTNDNLHALGFYQKRGFVLAALHPNALQVSRQLKPQISLIGLDGIPIRDEIELEMILSGEQEMSQDHSHQGDG